jgi:hypothetical protein
MWNLTSFSLETVLLSVQDRCTVCAKSAIGSEINLGTLDGTPRVQGSSESLLHLEVMLILTLDICTVCVECVVGLEIILDAHNGTPR